MSATAVFTLEVIGNNAPVLTNLAPLSQTATRGDSPQVTFDWSDVDGDIGLIRIELSNVLGDSVTELSAQDFFGIVGLSAYGTVGRIVMATVGAVVLLWVVGHLKKA